jgi:hypothetical protein
LGGGWRIVGICQALTWIAIGDVQSIVDTGKTLAANLAKVNGLSITDTLKIVVPVTAPVATEKASVQ